MKNKTELKDRTLWFDGDSSFNSEQLSEFIISSGKPIDDETFVNNENEKEVIKYNSTANENLLKEKTFLNLGRFNIKWKTPEDYKNIDLQILFANLLRKEFEIKNFSISSKGKRISRVKKELKLWEEMNKKDLLYHLIFLVDKLKENNIIWGTGRGSSCSSYLLFLIGLHQIDSVKYGLDINEFLR